MALSPRSSNDSFRFIFDNFMPSQESTDLSLLSIEVAVDYVFYLPLYKLLQKIQHHLII